MDLILQETIDKPNLIIIDEMKNLDDIEMKDGKIGLGRLRNSLDKFEMNELEKNKWWDRNIKKQWKRK